jgi:hypothetical protein
MRLAVLVLEDEGYLLGAAEKSDPWDDWSYWYIPDPQPGDTYVIYRLQRPVPRDVAEALLAQGTSEQVYSDGYEAMEVARRYGLREFDRWTVEGEYDEDEEEYDEDVEG